MKLAAVYRYGALHDIDTAYLYYEQQRDGLGEEFLEELAASIDRIVTNPESYPITIRIYRAAPLHPFP